MLKTPACSAAIEPYLTFLYIFVYANTACAESCTVPRLEVKTLERKQDMLSADRGYFHFETTMVFKLCLGAGRLDERITMLQIGTLAIVDTLLWTTGVGMG